MKLNIFILFILIGAKCYGQKSILPDTFSLIGKIKLEDFYNKNIAKLYFEDEPNTLDLVDYRVLSFAVQNDKLYLPNTLNKGIDIYEISNQGIKLKEHIHTNNKVDFLSVPNQHNIIYSNDRKSIINSIKNGIEKTIYSKANSYFKTNGSVIAYSHSFWFYNSKNNDSSTYVNLYTDWDYWYGDSLGFYFFYYNQDGSASLQHNKTIEKFNLDDYLSFKILGIHNKELILFVGDYEHLEIIYVDIDSLNIIKRRKIQNPFRENELMLGDAVVFWPNQLVQLMDKDKIYILGTTKCSIDLYSIDL